MVVVADTSAVNYLVLIGQIDVLPSLFTRVLIPPTVVAELTHPLAPDAVRRWAANGPAWLEVVSPAIHFVLPRLDLGESEAIALAVEMSADLLLIDDRAGREEALSRGLKVAGTLAVLDDADLAGIVIVDEVVAKLRKTGFRLSPSVLFEVRRRRAR